MGRPPKISYEKIMEMKFGRLSPIKNNGYVNGRMSWTCRCDCGNVISVIQKNLTNGNTKSCGCLQKVRRSARINRIESLYTGIKQRCYNPNESNYKYYGGKGISMCDEWLNDFFAFQKWLLDNGYDEKMPRGIQTIDRIDSNGNYSPENCRLISIEEQQRNKSSNKKYEYNGEYHMLPEWSEILGIEYSLLKARVQDRGWTIQQAIESPKNSKVNMDLKRLTFRNKTLTIKEWANELGIKENTIRGRMNYYSDVEKILKIGRNVRSIKASE